MNSSKSGTRTVSLGSSRSASSGEVALTHGEHGSRTESIELSYVEIRKFMAGK